MSLHDIALTFVMRHAPEHLDGADLVNRLTTHLSETHGISRHSAFQIASQAWAEYDSRNVAEVIDLNRTTARCVVMTVNGGRTVALTSRHLAMAVEILELHGVNLPGHHADL